MWWLILAGLLCAAGCSSSSSSHRRPTRGDSPEPELDSTQSDALRKLEEHLAKAKQRLERSQSCLAQAEEEAAAARLHMSLLRALAAFVFCGVVAFSLWVWIGTAPAWRLGMLAFLAVIWTGTVGMGKQAFEVLRESLSDAQNSQEQCLRAHASACQDVRKCETTLSATRERFVAEAKSRQAAALQERRDMERQQQRALESQAEDRRAAELRAWHLKTQIELAAHEAEKMRHDLAALIKAAFAHYRTAGRHPGQFVAVEAERLVAREAQILASYGDCSLPGATADDCLRLAAIGLREFPAEIAFWMPRPLDRTVEKVAYVLRRYNGDFRERLLPAAHELLHKRTPSGAAHAVEQSMPVASKKLGTTTGPLSHLPPDEQETFAVLLKDIRSLQSLEEVLEQELRNYEQSLRKRTPPLKENEMERALQKFAANLEKLKSDWAASKDLAA